MKYLNYVKLKNSHVHNQILYFHPLQEANDRILQARVRVAQQKARASNVQSVALPSIPTPKPTPASGAMAKSHTTGPNMGWSSAESAAPGGTFLTQPSALARTATVA